MGEDMAGAGNGAPRSIAERSSVWRPAVLPRSKALPGTLDRVGRRP